MTARDLPGIGDTGNPFGHVPPNSPDYDERWQDESTIEDDMQELRDWIDTFDAAVRSRDRRRMEQARDFARSMMDALILEWKP